MLIKIYLFSLLLGAVLLGASIFLGDADSDADMDGDADGAFDTDVDADGLDIGGADFFLWTFKSVRFWTFFVTFFGLTGLALDGLDLAASPIALALAIGMGFIAGTGASAVIRLLSSNERGFTADADDYIGKTARVLIPIKPGAVGKVRLELRGSTVDVLAKSDDGPFSVNEEAMVIAMDGTTARIARVDADNSMDGEENR